jgi:hypothetical protein
MTAEMENFVTASNIAPSLSVEHTAWMHTLRWVPEGLMGVLMSVSEKDAHENEGVGVGEDAPDILVCSSRSLYPTVLNVQSRGMSDVLGTGNH